MDPSSRPGHLPISLAHACAVVFLVRLVPADAEEDIVELVSIIDHVDCRPPPNLSNDVLTSHVPQAVAQSPCARWLSLELPYLGKDRCDQRTEKLCPPRRKALHWILFGHSNWASCPPLRHVFFRPLGKKYVTTGPVVKSAPFKTNRGK